MTVTTQEAWIKKYMGSMVGGKIVGVGVTDKDFEREGFPYFLIEHPKHGDLRVEVSSDEEGNGPGFLFGLPVPQ